MAAGLPAVQAAIHERHSPHRPAASHNIKHMEPAHLGTTLASGGRDVVLRILLGRFQSHSK